MAQIKKLKENGKTIYPVTTPKAVIDPSTGRAINAAATQSAAGLMSADDKTKLDNIKTININTVNINTSSKTFNLLTNRNVPSVFDALKNANPEDIFYVRYSLNVNGTPYYPKAAESYAPILSRGSSTNIVYFSFVVTAGTTSYLLTVSAMEDDWDFGRLSTLESSSEFALY